MYMVYKFNYYVFSYCKKELAELKKAYEQLSQDKNELLERLIFENKVNINVTRHYNA